MGAIVKILFNIILLFVLGCVACVVLQSASFAQQSIAQQSMPDTLQDIIKYGYKYDIKKIKKEISGYKIYYIAQGESMNQITIDNKQYVELFLSKNNVENQCVITNNTGDELSFKAVPTWVSRYKIKMPCKIDFDIPGFLPSQFDDVSKTIEEQTEYYTSECITRLRSTMEKLDSATSSLVSGREIEISFKYSDIKDNSDANMMYVKDLSINKSFSP